MGSKSCSGVDIILWLFRRIDVDQKIPPEMNVVYKMVGGAGGYGK